VLYKLYDLKNWNLDSIYRRV